MTAKEIIEKGEQFAEKLAQKLCDASETTASKQSFFMDNYANIQTVMQRLSSVVQEFEEKCDTEGVNMEDCDNLGKARETIAKMKSTIMDFQRLLLIDAGIQEEDLTVSVTKENVAEASKKITAEEAAEAGEDMDAFYENCNYALICDGDVTLIRAKDKAQLNEIINSLPQAETACDIAVYKIEMTPMPLTVKTTFVV